MLRKDIRYEKTALNDQRILAEEIPEVCPDSQGKKEVKRSQGVFSVGINFRSRYFKHRVLVPLPFVDHNHEGQ